MTGGSARFPDLARVAFAVARNTLADLLGRIRTPPRRVEEEPSVATLLDVDREYRDAAARGALRKIAPELFIPGGEAWLPVLHATRGPWHFTALYSNTARARTSADGRLISIAMEARKEGAPKRRGPREHRIVRGREAECVRAAANPPST